MPCASAPNAPCAVRVERIDLQLRHRIGNAVATVGGGHVVIGHGQIRADAPHRALMQLQAFERLRAGDFMQQMTVDIQQRRTVFFGVDHMGVPQFVVKSLCHGMRGRYNYGAKLRALRVGQLCHANLGLCAQNSRKAIRNKGLSW
jgi:hypothetical protein